MAAVKQQIDKATKRETVTWWKRSKRYKKTKSIDPSLPSGKYVQATAELNRNQTSILTQLRTGHIPLNGYLHRIGKAATPYCSHCPNAVEDVPHLLFYCNKYTLHRHKLTMAVNRKSFHIRHILSDPAAIRHTLNFVNDTGRFRHVHGDLSAELMDENMRR